MGKTYHFECPHCQYFARIAGGLESGRHCEVRSIICRDCRKLYDTWHRLRHRSDAEGGKPRKFSHVLLPEIPPLIVRDGKATAWVWKEFPPACPVNPQHTVELWNDPGRCPRCGVFLEKNVFPYRAWD